jgi:hypothetical protein
MIAVRIAAHRINHQFVQWGAPRYSSVMDRAMDVARNLVGSAVIGKVCIAGHKVPGPWEWPAYKQIASYLRI